MLDLRTPRTERVRPTSAHGYGPGGMCDLINVSFEAANPRQLRLRSSFSLQAGKVGLDGVLMMADTEETTSFETKCAVNL